jgi:uncharacterized membrane protein
MAKAPKHEVSDTQNEAQKNIWQGAFRAYGTAFDRIKANPEPAFLIVGTYATLAILSGILQGGKPYADSTYANIEDLAYLVFILALVTYSLALADDKKVSIREVMRFSLRKYVWILLAVVLYGLIIGASLLLLIIPAIWTIAWFYFQVYAVVDKNLGPIKALKKASA